MNPRVTPDKKKAGNFVGHAATYAIGNIARRFVGFAMLPIYTRYLSPADYGVIGLLTFALALFEPLFGARMGRAIPKFYFESDDRHVRRAVIWGVLGVTGAVSAVSMTALILLRGVGSQLLFGDRNYALSLGLFAVNLLSHPIEDTGMLYIRLQGRSRLFLTVSMVKLAMQVALNVLLVVYLQDGVVGAILSGILSSVAMGLALVGYMAVREPPAFDGQITRRMLAFSWPLWLSGLAGLYVGSSGGMYLRVFHSLSDVGRLELALRFATVVSALVWNPFFQHWEPMSYQYYREGGGERKFRVAFISIATLLFVSGLGISIFVRPVIRVMAAKAFQPAAEIVPILTLAFVLESLRSFFNFSFLATGHTKVHSLCQYITAIVITVLYFVLVPTLGLTGAALAQGLAFAAAFLYVRRISARYYDPGFNLTPIVTLTVIAAAAYGCADLVSPAGGGWLEFLVRSGTLVVAAALMAFVGIREVLSIDASALDGLRRPFGRMMQRFSS